MRYFECSCPDCVTVLATDELVEIGECPACSRADCDGMLIPCSRERFLEVISSMETRSNCPNECDGVPSGCRDCAGVGGKEDIDKYEVIEEIEENIGNMDSSECELRHQQLIVLKEVEAYRQMELQTRSMKFKWTMK